MLKSASLCTALLVCAASLSAQAPAGGNAISASHARMYTLLSGVLIAAAEKMPEENYSFQPAADVRTFGQLVRHLSDSQYYFCALASGETRESGAAAKEKAGKADLIAGLKEAIAYCTDKYAAMTDARGAEMVKLMGHDFTRLTVLSGNTAHLYEHYGNMSTYMRMKGIVPPTSEKSSAAGAK